jgi:hypothetical protein
MATKIRLKRSAVPNNVPTTSQLDLGEIAINTYDGKLYIKKDDGSESIVLVGPQAGNSAPTNQVVYGTGLSLTSSATFTYDPTTGNFTVNPGSVTSPSSISLTAASDSSIGNGGSIELLAGNGGSTSGDGGNITLNAGDASIGNGGDVFILAGTPTNGNGGDVTITASAGSGSNNEGGDVNITSGNSTGSSGAGTINLTSGSNPAGTGVGGNIALTAGEGGSGGGNITLTAGDSNNSSGNAGDVNIIGGNALLNGSGGNVTFTTGDSATGTAGNAIFNIGIGNATRGTFDVVHGSSNKFRVAANGYIGINQDTPTEVLHVGGNIRLTGSIKFPGGDITDSSLNGLSDVVISGPTNGQFLKYNGTNWVNSALGVVLDDISDVDIGVPTNGQVLYRSGSNWINQTLVIADISGLQTSLNGKLSLSGGTMTGPLILSGAPSDPNEATTKTYVDNADAAKVNKAGDSMTGLLTLSGDPTAPLHAATKQYVDNLAGGLVPHASVKAATTVNLSSLSGLLTVDGYTLSAGDRVLVKNQTTGSENGIYVASAGSWSRATDFDGTPSGEVSPGDFVFVENGTTNGGTSWILITPNPINVGTTTLTFTQFSGGAGSNPGGLDTQVQFNDGGTFGGDADFTWNKTTNTLTATNITTSGTLDVTRYVETGPIVSISSGTLTIDLATGTLFEVSLNQNISTLTINNAASSGKVSTFSLMFVGDGTPRTITWPASVKWPNDVPPTLSASNGAVDVFTFFTRNGGTTWYGIIAGQLFNDSQPIAPPDLRLDQILAAQNPNTIDNGNNTQTWRWSLGGSNNGLSIREHAVSTSTGTLFSIDSLASSTVGIFNARAQNGQGGITIDNNGFVTVNSGTTNPTFTIATTSGFITNSQLRFTSSAPSPQVTTATGTNLTINPGNATVTGTGPSLTLQSGNGLTTGAGGAINITAGNGTGTNQNGGTVTISGGIPTGTGTSEILLRTNNTTRLTVNTSGTIIIPGNMTVGTITSGTWNGTAVGTGFGGTGLTSIGSANQILGVNTGGSALEYKTVTAGTGVIVTPSANTITISLPQAVNTTSNVEIGSLGVGTPASGTAGEIRATNNITAYYSSDKRLKENIQPIDNALQKVGKISGVMFDWSDDYIQKHGGEDGYFIRKHDVGVIAQEVEEIMPEIVATREDGYKALRYERLVPLLIEAIKELKAEIDQLKKGK